MADSKRILMTGVSGQVGETLARQLARKHEIWGLARFSAEGSEERARSLGIHTLRCDLASGDFSCVPGDFDHVVHVAALLAPRDAEEGVRQNAIASGRLLDHCRRAKAFVHISTTGVYWPNPDPYHRYKETDVLGGMFPQPSHYHPSKMMSETAVRTVGQIHGVPTTILRLNVSYGVGGNGGLPGRLIDSLLAGRLITLPEGWPSMHSPIHEDDMVASIIPALECAAVDTTIVNWGGDEAVDMEDMVHDLAAQLGVEPVIARSETGVYPPRIVDPTRRQALFGRCAVDWKTGLRRLVAQRTGPAVVPAD